MFISSIRKESIRILVVSIVFWGKEFPYFPLHWFDREREDYYSFYSFSIKHYSYFHTIMDCLQCFLPYWFWEYWFVLLMNEKMFCVCMDLRQYRCYVCLFFVKLYVCDLVCFHYIDYSQQLIFCDTNLF